MTIKVALMKPFYSKITAKTLRIVFAYQYLSILKDDEIYHFVPVEGKEIIFNLDTRKVDNLSEVFVFQRGNRFIRMPLYQLILVCNDFLDNINQIAGISKSDSGSGILKNEINDLFQELEKMNVEHAINLALEERDFETCRKLVALCK